MLFKVCKKDVLQPGEKQEFTVNGKRIVLCCTNPSFYYATSALCPHEGARMAAGMLGGTTLQCEVGEYEYGRCHEILRCPWHGYEFDVKDGKALFKSEKMKLKSYPVTVEGEYLYLEM